ncbi:MAG: hypothetical protein ACRC9Y_06450 [Aeromonas veronii]
MISVIGIAVSLTIMIVVPAFYAIMYAWGVIADYYSKSIKEAGGEWKNYPDFLTEARAMLCENTPFITFIVTAAIHIVLAACAFVKCHTYGYTHMTWMDAWVSLWSSALTTFGPIVGWIMLGVAIVLGVKKAIRFLATVNVAMEKVEKVKK